MEFNTFNNFSTVDTEGKKSKKKSLNLDLGGQPNHPIFKSPEESHVMRGEEASVESPNQQTLPKKGYKTTSSEQKEDIIKGLKSESIIRRELTPPQQKAWREFVSSLENKQKHEKVTSRSLNSKIWKTMLRNVIPDYVSLFS